MGSLNGKEEAETNVSHEGVPLGSYKGSPFVTGRNADVTKSLVEGWYHSVPSAKVDPKGFTTEILDYKNGKWIQKEDYPKRYLTPNQAKGYVENRSSLFRASKLLN